LKFVNNNAATIGDSVRAYYLSTCGNGSVKSTKLNNANLTAPAMPASIGITLVSDICGSRIYRYSAPAPPNATANAMAASGYEWFLPTGSAVATSASLDSGALIGANARYIKLKFTNNGAAANTDSIRLRYTSGCGNSATKAQKLSNLVKVCLTNGTEITSRVATTSVETAALNVYPNPNNGNFTISAKTSVTAKSNATIQIIDMLGKVVAQVNAQNNNGTINTNINNSNLKNGVYTVRIMVGNDIKTVKMVVKK
jgi:hypothetical protein